MSTRTPPPRRRIVGDPLGMTNLTNIDRRMCHRVVPMKVLGMGLSRTGTSCKSASCVTLIPDTDTGLVQLSDRP